MLERWRRQTSTRAVKVLLPSMVLLAGCPQQCGTTPSDGAPAAAPAAAAAPGAAPPFVPQAGAVFVEDFATAGGFYDRFDFGLSLHNERGHGPAVAPDEDVAGRPQHGLFGPRPTA